ncbi:MAG: peptidylprolyl isomerase [Flavobacteriales bacterium]|nr:peptidylprolyl isomerase [Flavobacteriales bacterium]MCW8912786.1 peptidylprolyl isomerase [Flavobacteriales bacterium]MCW8938790.1 peptidylprolyl isomerase [Flavobacteriales bacterium]MCW8968500.1 peptidylprolyl isomerase [Flavobacteriales bacterium]MCW8989444.1 peptidylprolyl isomerase [Flavobacteriales bacterium]
MKKLIVCISFILGTLVVFAQKNESPILLEIGDKKITLEEFEAIYNKNSDNKKNTKEEVEDYLDLYIKFKLKVVEAEDLGMDTLPAFTQELEGYRKQLAQPYLSDREVTEKLIEEAYQRMKYDVKAAHILVKVTPEADPKDTLVAYNKIMKIRKRIVGGEDFEKVAAEVSEDPSAKNNQGNLGYFSAFQMVYPFETAAYETEVGKISMPVRTSFGYHLVKTIDKRKARGIMKVAHIMVRADKKLGEEEINQKKEKIDEIYTKVTAKDADFKALTRQYSEDKESAKRGGELPAFGAGKMVEEFETAAFALENDGDISAPILTDYGWHIIKRLELKNLESYEELYPTLKAKVARDSRANKSKEIVIENIKKENNFKEDLKRRNDFYTAVDQKKFNKGEWKAEDVAKLDKVMFGFYPADGEKFEYRQTQFAKRLENHMSRNEPTNVDLKPYINKLYNTVVEEMTMRFKNRRLPIVNKEFRMLLQEYREGILLFNITDEKVWSKAVKDTAGLEAFYEANKQNYMWGERADALIYKCSNEKIAKKVEKLIKAKAKKGYSNEDILKQINKDSQLNLTIEEGKFTKDQNELVAKAKWENKAVTKLNNDNEIVLIEVKEVLPPQPKLLDEIRGLVTSDYQNKLEKEWIAKLKAKYPVKIHKEVLSKLQ